MPGQRNCFHMWCLLLELALLPHLVHANGDNKDPHVYPGRSAIVHLFEWRWDDIAAECERFLGPMGYAGVQVSPANENAIIYSPGYNADIKRPWYERYQPVSYKLITRSGNEDQFQGMVQRCNAVHVRIYVDVVINHMTGMMGAGHGTGGSYFDSGALRYDGVPYSSLDFNTCDRCPSHTCNIEHYVDPNEIRNCRLMGLNDLDQGNDYVRQKIGDYLNNLIDIGVAGFRIDAAKHMWPSDVGAILGSLHDLNDQFLPGSKPFIFQEVIYLGGEAVGLAEYIGNGRVTEFRYGFKLGNVLRRNDRLKYLQNFGQGWGFVEGNDALVFIDNHDNQRGHGAGGLGTIVTNFESRLYKMATAFMLAWPYGYPRVMSSYAWDRHIVNDKDENDWIGPPHDEQYNTLEVTINQDLTCGNGWVCEHRWRQIYNMMRFRNVVGTTPVANWWDNGSDQIAFSRGAKGFLAINNEDFPINKILQTGMSPGKYCDIISGNIENGNCTGRIVEVDAHGMASFEVDNTWEDPMIAIHAESKLDWWE